MDKSSLKVMNTYNDDANKLLLDIAREFSDEELKRSSSPSHDSVMGLLRHMLEVEAYFLALCRGAPYIPRQDDLPTLQDVLTNWEHLASSRQAYLASISEEELQADVRLTFGSMLSFTRAQMLLQSLVHSIHHRGELSIVMTGLGHPLPTLDIILHFTRQSGREWP